MSDYRKQAKIDALDKVFPGKSCGNYHCEEICAESYYVAKQMRIDPFLFLSKTLEREFHCRKASNPNDTTCRFGMIPQYDFCILAASGKVDVGTYVFHANNKECAMCRALDGIRVSAREWANESIMQKKGFWKNNNTYLPHPHCKCHWEKSSSIGHIDTTGTNTVVNEGYSGKSVIATVSNADTLFSRVIEDFTFAGGDDLIKKLEKDNPPHSIGKLTLINHGWSGAVSIGNGEYLEYYDSPVHKAKIERLKKLLSNDAIVEIRMCEVGAGDEGAKTGQQLANMLGCRVKVYEEYVTPYGTRPFLSKDQKTWQNGFQRPKYKIYVPQD